MKHRPMQKPIVCVFLCIALLVSSCVCFSSESFAADSSQIDSLNRQNEDLEEQQKQIDEKIEQARKDIENQEELKNSIEEKISLVEKEIDNLNLKINEYNDKIDLLQKQIDGKNAEIQKGYQRLKKRLRMIYMAGNASTLEVILGSKSFSDFIDKITLVQCVGKADEKLINSLKESISEIDSNKEEQEKARLAVDNDKTKLEKNREELEKLSAQAQVIIDELKQEQENLQADDEAYKQQQKELEAQITQWYRNYFAENGDEVFSDGTTPGRYAWPAPYCDVVTTEYGVDGHNGIDIACNGSAYGLPIVAAEDGTVAIANRTDEWGSGWGYYIMLNHGDGFGTLYAHCSIIVADAGQQVKKGQVIGYIGNTGRSYGAHLHFECWHNGSRYNPRIDLGTE